MGRFLHNQPRKSPLWMARVWRYVGMSKLMGCFSTMKNMQGMGVYGILTHPHTSSTLVFRIPFSHVQYLETFHRHMHWCCRLDKRIFHVKMAESEPKPANRKKGWSWASHEQMYTTSWSDYLSDLSPGLGFRVYHTFLAFLSQAMQHGSYGRAKQK
jgi:hypothetical protein